MVARDVLEIARERAIALTRRNFGSLADLTEEVAAVAWVVTFRACEIGIIAEQSGGEHGLLKNILIGDGKLMPNLREHTIRLQFLNKMVPIIRNQSDARLRVQDGQILIDCLKWNIIDACTMSVFSRVIVRKFKKADPLYKLPIPQELLS